MITKGLNCLSDYAFKCVDFTLREHQTLKRELTAVWRQVANQWETIWCLEEVIRQWDMAASQAQMEKRSMVKAMKVLAAENSQIHKALILMEEEWDELLMRWGEEIKRADEKVGKVLPKVDELWQ